MVWWTGFNLENILSRVLTIVQIQELKLKQESSCYPLWVQSEEDKDGYIQDYRRAEGIF